jgi:hypothetical protein
MDILAFWVFLAGKFGLNLKGVCPKVISLCLKQVGGQILGAIAVEPAEGSTESWSWYAKKCSLRDDISPAWLSLVDSLVEEVVKEKILEIWILSIRCSDILQENGSNDTASTPHECNRGLVKFPFVFLSSLVIILVHVNLFVWNTYLLHKHESLRIRDDL